MPMERLPTVEPFTLPRLGWTFTDARTDGKITQAHLARRIWLGHVQRVLARRSPDPKSIVCNDRVGGARHERDLARFHEARKTDRRLDWKTYRERWTPERETDRDPGRLQAFFIIEDGRGQIIGGLSCSNLSITDTSTPSTLAVSGVYLAGIPDAPNGSTADAWIPLFAELMKMGLPMRNGRQLRLERYEFLADEDIREQASTDIDLRRFVDGMAAHFQVIGSVDNPAGRIEFRHSSGR